MYSNGSELLNLCDKDNLSLYQVIINEEMKQTMMTKEAILKKIDGILEVMVHSVTYAMEHPVSTLGGLIGGESKKLMQYRAVGEGLSDGWILKAMARAFSALEHNGSMGRICAAPTAGSCGILPAALITMAEKYNLSRQLILEGMVVASGVGKIISENATVAGAEGGCQAECGSAAAMTAAALVYMMGGSPKTSFDAAAIALKNIMGLICDPIAGLVEAPCAKRNASGVVNAITSADMALAGIQSIIPFDEVVEAMYTVGKNMHTDFKETARGGMAATPTGRLLADKLK